MKAFDHYGGANVSATRASFLLAKLSVGEPAGDDVLEVLEAGVADVCVCEAELANVIECTKVDQIRVGRHHGSPPAAVDYTLYKARGGEIWPSYERTTFRRLKTALIEMRPFVNLILPPVFVSIAGVCLFLFPILAGGVMLLRPSTAGHGRAVLIYAAGSFLVGLACVWVGFALLLLALQSGPLAPSIERATILAFWASGPLGALLGLFLGDATRDATSPLLAIASSGSDCSAEPAFHRSDFQLVLARLLGHRVLAVDDEPVVLRRGGSVAHGVDDAIGLACRRIQRDRARADGDPAHDLADPGRVKIARGPFSEDGVKRRDVGARVAVVVCGPADQDVVAVASDCIAAAVHGCARSGEVGLRGASTNGGPLFDLAGSTASPSAQVAAREHSQRCAAVDRLPEDYRRAITLRYEGNLTFEEIGREMGRSAEAARKVWGGRWNACATSGPALHEPCPGSPTGRRRASHP